MKLLPSAAIGDYNISVTILRRPADFYLATASDVARESITGGSFLGVVQAPIAPAGIGASIGHGPNYDCETLGPNSGPDFLIE